MALTKEQLLAIPNKEFGLPKEKKFPMQDETHLKAAIAYFYTAAPKKRKELANNIVRRHKELNSKIKISKKNPLFKYVPEDMKNLQESSNLFDGVLVENVEKLFGVLGKVKLEALMECNLCDIDDLDHSVQEPYADKKRFLGVLKSSIMNEYGDNYPVIYTDFNANKDLLNGNNGGIRNLSESSIILDYNGTQNEFGNINTIKESSHIQYCSLLREWYELYNEGHRNYTYDRMMIESWKNYLGTLLETSKFETNGDDTIKIANAVHDFDKEKKQKLVDMGYYDKATDNIPESNDVVKQAAEIGFKISNDIKDKHFDPKEDDPEIFQNAITIKTFNHKDNSYAYQSGEDITFNNFWKM